MPYTNAENIAKRLSAADLISLTSDTGEAVDSTVLDWAITTVGKEIDGYLVGSYELPLEAVPGKLETVADDMVIYHLSMRRNAIAGSMIESIESSYKRAIEYLKDIRAGRLDLFPKEDDTTGGVSPGIVVLHKPGTERLFSPNQLKKMPL